MILLAARASVSCYGGANFNHPDFAGACIPSANGVFTARSLAKLYAVLANGGELNGVRILSRDGVNRIMQI